MAVGASRSDFVLFESPRNNAVSIESGIELSQASLHYSPRHSQNCSSRNSRPFHPYITPYVNSRLIFDARNEKDRMSVSNPDQRQTFTKIIFKLARHSWTESTEFVELWSDIPRKATDQKGTNREQTVYVNFGTSVSNVIADSNHDSSHLSWVLSKHPWTASEEFIELWSDIPNDFLISQNLSEDREEPVVQSDAATFSKDMINIRQDELINSKIYKNTFIESENHTEASNIAPDVSICNQNHSKDLENNHVFCCRLLLKCFFDVQNLAMSFGNHMFILVIEILLSLIPISAYFMGAIHFGKCPANEAATTLVYMTGLAGVFLIGCHISYHFSNEWKEGIRCAIKVFQTITAVLLTLEMIIFYSMSPSFENSENYCDEIFYNYTFYVNIAATGIVFLSILLQYTCKHQVDNEAFWT